MICFACIYDLNTAIVKNLRLRRINHECGPQYLQNIAELDAQARMLGCNEVLPRRSTTPYNNEPERLTSRIRQANYSMVSPQI